MFQLYKLDQIFGTFNKFPIFIATIITTNRANNPIQKMHNVLIAGITEIACLRFLHTV